MSRDRVTQWVHYVCKIEKPVPPSFGECTLIITPGQTAS